MRDILKMLESRDPILEMKRVTGARQVLDQTQDIRREVERELRRIRSQAERSLRVLGSSPDVVFSQMRGNILSGLSEVTYTMDVIRTKLIENFPKPPRV